MRNRALQLRFDAFELDEADARLRRDGAPLTLAPKAFGVLCALARQPGQLVTKDALLDAVWGHRHVSESVLKTTISELRAVLEDDAKRPRYIETASRRGYRFIAVPRAPGISASEERGANEEKGTVPISDGASQAASSVGEMGTVPLIGREAALAQLRDAWARAQRGERQLVWVAGEAGVGKTSVIEGFVRELPAGVATFGQCIEEFGTGEPYLPILEAVRELCRRNPALTSAMRDVAPTWLMQMPWLVGAGERAALHGEVGGVNQDRMVREMRELMDRFTADRPLVFVLEDLHWSDAGTLHMMEHFARRPREVRLLWIASFRLTQVVAEDHPLRALRQELRLHKLCREIVLEPFTEAEVGSYLSQRLPGGVFPDNFVRRVHAHTDGLPLFVANVADSFLAQTGGEPRALAALTQVTNEVPLPVPDSLAGVIEKRIARVPADAQRLLEAASVLGMEFRASQLAALLARDLDWVCDECDQLARRQSWLKLAGIDELADGIDPYYAFQHALYKHVFYERAAPSARVQWHRRAVRELEAARAAGKPVPAAELASHADRGHHIAAALRYYGEAADYAVAHFTPHDALGLTAAGLKLLTRVADGPERAELELGLVHRRGVAAAQLLGIGSPEAVAAFERTLALCDALPSVPQRALLLSGLGITRYVCADYPAAQQLAERVLASGERHDDDILRVTAALLLGMVHAARGEHRASCARFESGIAACRRIAAIPPGIFVIDPWTQLHANIAIPLMSLGLADQARRHIDSAHARARAVGQPTARMLASWTDGMVHVRAQDPARVARCADDIMQVVEKSMLTQGAGPGRWLRGWAMAHQGSPAEGYRLIREGYEAHARLGMYAGNTETLGYAAMALVLAQDWERADAQVEEALALAERIDERVMYPYLLRLRAEVAAARAGRRRAREIFADALAAARAQSAPFEELKCLYSMSKLGLAEEAELLAMRAAFAAAPEGRDLPFMKKVDAALS